VEAVPGKRNDGDDWESYKAGARGAGSEKSIEESRKLKRI
jgi:hypothetical protein